MKSDKHRSRFDNHADAAVKVLREGMASDAEVLTALAMRSKAHWGYDAAFMAMCREELTMTPERIASQDVIVAESEDGTVRGFASCSREADGTAEVEACFVEPDAIGTGVGRAILAAALDRIRAAGAVTVFVVSDPQAEGFYARAGFRAVDRVPSGSVPGRTLPRLRLDF